MAKTIRRVPYFKQRASYTCGPASIKMVFRFFGLKLNDEELVRSLKATKSNGTRHMALINLARKKGFYCFVHENSSLNTIKHFVDIDLPVIINYIEPSEDEGHYAVVTGYKKGRLIIHDPWNGKHFSLSYGDFQKRWKSKYESGSKRWILVLSKKPFNIGKQYFPSILSRIVK